MQRLKKEKPTINSPLLSAPLLGVKRIFNKQTKKYISSIQLSFEIVLVSYIIT